MKTVILLTIANVFMTFAWYGHLKHMNAPLWSAIFVSWLIAGAEYIFQVPANRLGAQAGWSGFQLKITQEVITICVFIVFAVLYLKEPVRWNHAAAFVMILGAVALVFGVKPEKIDRGRPDNASVDEAGLTVTAKAGVAKQFIE